MERLFNVLPSEIRDLHEISTEIFKRNIDTWLKTVPDEPRIDNYALCVVAEKNSKINQARHVCYMLILPKGKILL